MDNQPVYHLTERERDAQREEMELAQDRAEWAAEKNWEPTRAPRTVEEALTGIRVASKSFRFWQGDFVRRAEVNDPHWNASRKIAEAELLRKAYYTVYYWRFKGGSASQARLKFWKRKWKYL